MEKIDDFMKVIEFKICRKYKRMGNDMNINIMIPVLNEEKSLLEKIYILPFIRKFPIDLP